MTKARDTANLVATGVPNSLITLDAAEIPNISTDKLTSGTLANARVADLPTSKITSGTFADARISESSVTAHVTETDLQPIKSDISALALREATNEASAAFNLPNQFIETFTDDTNLGTQTTGDRTSGYWSTIVSSTAAFTDDSDTGKLLHMEDNTDSAGNPETVTLNGSAAFSTTQYKFGAKSLLCSSSSSSWGSIGAGNDLDWGTGALTAECWAYITNRTSAHQSLLGRWYSPTLWDMRWEASDASGNFGLHDNSSMRNSGVAPPLNEWHHFAWTRDGSGNNTLWYDGVSKVTWSGTNTHNLGTNDLYIGRLDGSTYTTGFIDEVRLSSVARYTTAFTPNETITVNATGTLIQSANAVGGSDKTKVGGTMLYKDNAGTATLGTDLKIYFSCNNGGAWTEATSYNAITPVYSTGVKQVRLGETTCTAGTGIIYKAVWANQASGSKETQLHGIGINY